jgi:hypothetical protein
MLAIGVVVDGLARKLALKLALRSASMVGVNPGWSGLLSMGRLPRSNSRQRTRHGWVVERCKILCKRKMPGSVIGDTTPQHHRKTRSAEVVRRLCNEPLSHTRCGVASLAPTPPKLRGRHQSISDRHPRRRVGGEHKHFFQTPARQPRIRPSREAKGLLECLTSGFSAPRHICTTASPLSSHRAQPRHCLTGSPHKLPRPNDSKNAKKMCLNAIRSAGAASTTQCSPKIETPLPWCPPLSMREL